MRLIRSFHISSPALARILASDSIESVCGEIFRQKGHELVEKPGISRDELLRTIGEFDGLVVRSATKVTKEVIDAGVNLKIIGRAGTGVDNIDVRSATAKGQHSPLLFTPFLDESRNPRCQHTRWKYYFNR
jgi:phosphoglycerate dehydrogenase-like enzyme